MIRSVNSCDVLIRCDASVHIGTGHLARCLSLAKFLSLYQSRIIFFCRDHDGSHTSLLGDLFECYSLSRPNPLVSTSEHSTYLDWLGCSQYEDALECIEASSNIANFSPSLIVVDHYGIDSTWEMQILSSFPGSRLIAVDDLFNRSHCSHITVNPSIVDIISFFQFSLPLVNFLVRDFLFLPLTIVRIVSSSVRCNVVLVFFGGMDSGNYCSLV